MKKIEKPILELSNISHSSKKAAIDRLSLTIPRSDSFAVIYRSEDSVSLLFDILSGKVTPKKGKVFFKGDDITGMKNRFGTVRSDASIPKIKTAADYAAAPIIKRGLSRSMTDVLVRKELQKLGLSEIADVPMSKLNKEQKAWAQIFAAYMCSHELIAIDEPFSQFEGSAKLAAFDRLDFLKKQNGTSLLIFTKDIDTAIRFTDYVMVADKNTASGGIIAVDHSRIERAREQISERIASIYKE